MMPTGAVPAQGAFAGMASIMSPAASPPQSTTPVPPSGEGRGPAPSGSTPNAKRPMDRAAVDVVIGGARSMSIEDLSAGFVNLERVLTRDEAFAAADHGVEHRHASVYE